MRGFVEQALCMDYKQLGLNVFMVN